MSSENHESTDRRISERRFRMILLRISDFPDDTIVIEPIINNLCGIISIQIASLEFDRVQPGSPIPLETTPIVETFDKWK